MVTNEFFDKEAYLNKGKPPYFAAIPSSNILSIFDLPYCGLLAAFKSRNLCASCSELVSAAKDRTSQLRKPDVF